MKLHAVKRIMPWSIRFLVGFALLWYLFSLIDLTSILAAFQTANGDYLAVAVVLVLPNIGLQWLKWRFLLRKGATVVRDYEVTASLFCGFALGLITPVRLVEFGGRALMFPSDMKMKIAGLTLIDKAATMSVTVATGVIASWLFALHTHWFYWSTWTVVLPAAFVFIVTVIVVTKRRAVWKWLRYKGQHIRRADELMTKMENGFAIFPTRDLLYVILLSSLFYLTFVTQFYMFLNAFIDPGFWWTTIAIMTIMIAKTMAPALTLGELGVREGLSVLLLGFLGISQAAALSSSLLLFVTNILFPSFIGVVFVFRVPVVVRAAT